MKKYGLKCFAAAVLFGVLLSACGKNAVEQPSDTAVISDSSEKGSTVKDSAVQDSNALEPITNEVVNTEITGQDAVVSGENANGQTDEMDKVNDAEGRNLEDKMREVRELEEEEVLAFVKKVSGIDFSGYISGASGVTYSNLYYVRLYITGGMEADAEELVKELCGDGFDPSQRMIPKANNRICDEMRRLTPIRGYDYMHLGENGAKTAQTTFYTAVENGETSIFVFGH